MSDLPLAANATCLNIWEAAGFSRVCPKTVQRRSTANGVLATLLGRGCCIAGTDRRGMLAGAHSVRAAIAPKMWTVFKSNLAVARTKCGAKERLESEYVSDPGPQEML